ncbi:MAG: RNA polymerase sigma factor region1.1 domain-containing protein [Hyphomicrobiaceae bacterium]
MSDHTLLDLDDPRVRRQLKAYKARGWIALDELHALLPAGDVSPDEIEAAMSMLAGLGIAVVDPDDAAGQLGVSVGTVLDLARALGVRPGEIAFIDGDIGELATQIAEAVLDTIEHNRAIVKAQIAEAVEQSLACRLTPGTRRAVGVVSLRP